MIRPYLNADRQVSLEGFARFLEEAHAAIYNLPKRKLHHDMTRPLHEYYINSSHNTYLSGHQLHGKSTVEAYARALQLGYVMGDALSTRIRAIEGNRRQ